MLSSSETVRPPQPARMQSQADSFYSRGHSKNVSLLVSISPDDFSPASSTKSRWTHVPGFIKSLKRTEPWLLVDLYTKPHPRRSGAFVALTRRRPETVDETDNSVSQLCFWSRELNFGEMWLCCGRFNGIINVSFQRVRAWIATSPSDRTKC